MNNLSLVFTSGAVLLSLVYLTTAKEPFHLAMLTLVKGRGFFRGVWLLARESWRSWPPPDAALTSWLISHGRRPERV